MHKGVAKQKGRSRSTLPVTLSPSALNALDAMIAETGMAKVTMIQRIIEWVADAPDVVQKIVLGIHPKGMDNELAVALEKMAQMLRDREPMELLSVEREHATPAGPRVLVVPQKR